MRDALVLPPPVTLPRRSAAPPPLHAPTVAPFLLAIPGRPDTLVAAPAGTTLPQIGRRLAASVGPRHFLVMPLGDGDWTLGDDNPRPPELTPLLPARERIPLPSSAAGAVHRSLWRLTHPGTDDRLVTWTAGATPAELVGRCRALGLVDPGSPLRITPVATGAYPVRAEGSVAFPIGVSLDEGGHAYGPIPRLPAPAWPRARHDPRRQRSDVGTPREIAGGTTGPGVPEPPHRARGESNSSPED